MLAIPTCDWSHPGASPYTGTAESAIMALDVIPLDARQRLAARARDSFDYFVFVQRDSITSKGQEFEREVSMMNFGDGAKVCADVNRSTWADSHVETAMVYCDGNDGYCVGKFAVCGNWAIFTRSRAKETPAVVLPPAASEDVPVLTALPAMTVTPLAGMSDVAMPSYQGGSFESWGGGGFSDSGGGVVYVPSPPCAQCCATPTPPPITPPVPEPATWLLMLAGLATLIRKADTP
jgi:hypothetical protein